MENIVAHSLEKLYTEFEKADQLFLDSGMKDMDAYEKGLAVEVIYIESAGHSNANLLCQSGRSEKIHRYRKGFICICCQGVHGSRVCWCPVFQAKTTELVSTI